MGVATELPTVDCGSTDGSVDGGIALCLFSYPLKTRIDTMIEKGFTILVSDANCADKAVQRYLAEKRYQNVIVHCMTANCRNNVGEWPTAPQGARGFVYILDQGSGDGGRSRVRTHVVGLLEQGHAE
jgi:hypothetical protein